MSAPGLVCVLCGGRWATMHSWEEFSRIDLCYQCFESWRDGRLGVRFDGVRYLAQEGRGTKRWRRTDDHLAYRAGLRERLNERGKR